MLGSRVMPALLALVDELNDAGVPASLNRSEVNTPGAWVSPQTIDVTTLDGGGTARVHIVLVVGDLGDTASHTALLGLVDKVLTLGLFPADEGIDTGWSLMLRDQPLPAYRFPIDLDI